MGVVFIGPDAASAASNPITAWVKAVTEHVWRHRAFPPRAIGQKANAGVTFVVDRSGKLISSALVESTGVAALDTETLAIVERSAPFPKPPVEVKDELQRMTILMTFDGTRADPGDAMLASPWPTPEQERFLKSWTEEQSKLSTKFPGPGDAKMNSMLRSICRGC